MRKLKIKLWQPNYFCISNTHLFVNFIKSNLDYIKEMNPASIHTIHVFITTHTGINEYLRVLITRLGKHSKIIVHLPYELKALEKLAREFLGEKVKWKLVTERVGPIFTIERYGYFLCFEYHMKYLDVYTIGRRTSCPVKIDFFKYPYEDIEGDNDPGIFKTPEMRLNPEDFRDQLLEAFKRDCPSGILKAFKTDDEIFEYILQQGEWNINGEE